jgi:hypothetical protein
MRIGNGQSAKLIAHGAGGQQLMKEASVAQLDRLAPQSDLHGAMHDDFDFPVAFAPQLRAPIYRLVDHPDSHQT